MKKNSFLLLYFIGFLSSCQKNISDFDPSQQPIARSTGAFAGINGGLIATVDGTQLNLAVVSATLTHFPSADEKRMDIAAISADNKIKIVLTLGDESSQGNEIAKRKYVLNAFPVDDPATPNIDESVHFQGYTTYGTSSGTGWIFDIYNEAGSCTISSCDASTTLISGVFETALTLQANNTKITKITSGRITNVKYRVMN